MKSYSDPAREIEALSKEIERLQHRRRDLIAQYVVAKKRKRGKR